MRVGGGDRSKPVGNTKDIKSKSITVPRSQQRAILDSGTTDTYLHVSYQPDFEQAWKDVTGKKFFGSGKAVYLTDQQLEALPTLLLDFEAKTTVNDLNTVRVAFPPSHYMEFSPTTGKYYTRIYFEYSNQNDLGANFLMGHDVMFDIENSRIGFAESECDYNALVSEDITEQGQGGSETKKESSKSGASANGGSSTVQPPASRSPPQSGNSGGFCSGAFCRFSMFVLAAAVGGLVTAFLMKPEVMARIRAVIQPGEHAAYQRAPVEISMSSIGRSDDGMMT